jgi:hypothetical protein
MMLYSYVITRDYGFAPNPFHGVCTLATCKPVIRRIAKTGDWIIGTGSAEYQRTGQLICAMRVSESMTFDDYWADPRFRAKRPDLTGSKMQAFGDNIYSRDDSGQWVQLDSHHSRPGGEINPDNVADDTQTNRVLIATEFSYFGADAPLIPAAFRGEGIANVCAHRGHRSNFAPGLVEAFLDWLSHQPSGCVGRPDRWP